MRVATLCLICLLFVASNQLLAQKTIDRKKIKTIPRDYIDYYITDKRLNRFVGTWVYDGGSGNKFVIDIEKLEHYNMKEVYKVDMTMETGRARYAYVADSTKSFQWQDECFFITANTRSKRELGFVITDALSGQVYTGRLVISRKDWNQATLKLGHIGGLGIRGPDGKKLSEKPKNGVQYPNGVINLRDRVFRKVDGISLTELEK